MVVDELNRLKDEYFLEFDKTQAKFVEMVNENKAKMLEVEAC